MRKKRKSNKTRSDLSTKRKKVVAKKKAIIKKITKIPKTRAAGTLTEAEYFSKIRSALRRAFRWWKPMISVLESAARPYKGPNKLQKKEFLCASCSSWFKRKEVQIDHIEPCGRLMSYDDVVPFIKRLTAENQSAYQVLCKLCHSKKTDEEKIIRKKEDNSKK